MTGLEVNGTKGVPRRTHESPIVAEKARIDPEDGDDRQAQVTLASSQLTTSQKGAKDKARLQKILTRMTATQDTGNPVVVVKAGTHGH